MEEGQINEPMDAPMDAPMDDAAEPTIWCPLCRCATDYIQSYHFLLEEQHKNGVGTGKLIRRHYTSILRFTEEQRSQEVTAHDYCWKIARRVFRKDHFDQTWVDRFKDHLFFLRDFLEVPPFQNEPYTLDPDIFAILKPANPNKGLRARGHIPLPPELIQMIYRFLWNDEDVINLSTVLHVEPCLEQWEELGYKYMLVDDLDPRANVTTLIQNVQRMPQDRYPKTISYRVIWNNMDLVRKVMENCICWQELPKNSPVIRHVSLGGLYDSHRYALKVPEDSYTAFIFDESGDVQRLRGIMINGFLVGHEDGAWKSVHVKSLKGLKVASVQDCLVGVQIKERDSWQATWHGDCPPSSLHTQIEWKFLDDELVLSHNGAEIVEIGVYSARNSA